MRRTMTNEQPRDLWRAYLRDYVVVQVGTDPRRYAAALDTPALPIFGPLRATKKAALRAGWEQYRAAQPRANPRANDPTLTVATLHLKRIAPGAYEHRNLPTSTTWRIAQREVPGRPSWTFHNVAQREGGNDVFYSKADAAEALVHYLRGRFRDPQWGWCTR